MTTQNLALFKALGSKMDFLSQRQRILSQNIANSDTPDYRPQDLVPVDFGTVLKGITKDNGVHIETTNAMHMPSPSQIADPDEKTQKKVYEIAPVGNAVIMEEQLIQSNQTVMDYNLMTNLYQKNVQLIKTALGRQ